MGPASCFYDPVSFVEWMKSRIGIGLERSLEGLEMGLWMLSAAVGREGEPDRGRNRIGTWTAIAHIGPEPSGLGSSVARREPHAADVPAGFDGKTASVLPPSPSGTAGARRLLLRHAMSPALRAEAPAARPVGRASRSWLRRASAAAYQAAA